MTFKGFESFVVPVTEDVLVRKRINDVKLIRRSIRESVSLICQNPKNGPGSLRTRSIETPGVYGDVMNSPMLRRIESLTGHLWAASGVPVEEQLTLYTVISNDGTPIIRGCNMPVEASTVTVANLERDDRTSHGNVKLLSVYRELKLHNPAVASQKKQKHKPTQEEREALW